MADWTLPLLSDLKVDVLDMLKLRDVDAITLSETPTSPPTGAVRWSRSLNKFQTWSGTAWVDLVISHAGGGTGATTPGGITAGLGLGTMSTQNSNAVSITGGSITGLSGLHVAGNIDVDGIIYAGSGNIAHNNSAGYLPQASIEDAWSICNTNQIETITGLWMFNPGLHANGSIRIQPDQASAGLNRISLGDGVNSSCPAYIQAYEPGASGQYFIISNNYYGIDGSSSGRRNTAVGGSFIRLAPAAISLIGIDGTGALHSFLTGQPSYVTSHQPNFQVGNGTGTATIEFLSNNLSYIKFLTGASATGTIGHAGGATYYDSNTHNWRSSTGAITYASIDATGKFSAYGLQTNSGWIYNSSGGFGINLVSGSTQMFGDTFYWTDAANTFHIMTLSSGSALNLPAGSARFNIGGPQGGGMSMWKSGANAVFSCHQGDTVSGATIWHNAADTVQLMILNGSTLTPHGGLALNNGSSAAPAIRFVGSPTSGAYFSPVEQTAEYGCNFAIASARSIMRAFRDSAMVDFMTGDGGRNLVLTVTQAIFGADYGPHVLFARETRPYVHHSYNCGYPGNAWYALYSLNPVQITSDIRYKDIHGPLTDVLDVIESVDTFIASFKDSFKPVENTYSDWNKRFPSFSAQDILTKIDAKYGTRIVDDSDVEHLSAAHERLMPLMWQAIKELYARVKALESN